MSKKNLYKEDVIVSNELDLILKRYLLNHLVLYNYSIDILEKNSDIRYKELRKKLQEYIVEKNIKDFIPSCLYQETYYLYKKYKNNVNKLQKCLTEIQYLTFYINSYNNKIFSLVDNKIVFKNIEGYILLNKALPTLEEKELIYFNISYSNKYNKYQLSIFK